MLTGKGVGYCHNGQCSDFLKGVFILNGDKHFFYCPLCRERGKMVNVEYGEIQGGGYYTSVELHFDYLPGEDRYFSKAVVTLNDIPPGHTYVQKDPLIKTESRALKKAEQLLCALNSGLSPDRPEFAEIICSFDSPAEDFREEMRKLTKIIEQREEIIGKRLQYA